MKYLGNTSITNQKINSGLIRPQFFAEPKTFADLFLAIEFCPVEISGFGKIEKEGNFYILTGELVIFDQECEGGGTEFDINAHSRWITSMVKNGQGELINQYRFWWHSHVFEPACFSDIDRDTINSWGDTCDEWWISFVGNKWGEYKVRLDVLKPIRKDPYYMKVQLTEYVTVGQMRKIMLEREEYIKDIVKKKVRITEPPFKRILSGLREKGVIDS